MNIPRRLLKLTPAVALELLLAMWAASSVAYLSFDLSGGAIIHISNGEVGCFFTPDRDLVSDFHFGVGGEFEWPIGSFDYASYAASGAFMVTLPLAWAVTAVLPFSLGPFLSFRFRLWHYLAFMALVAVELAYYLRWQG